MAKKEEENWQKTREAYELFKVEPIQKEGESDDNFSYRNKSWEFQKEEYGIRRAIKFLNDKQRNTLSSPPPESMMNIYLIRYRISIT